MQIKVPLVPMFVAVLLGLAAKASYRTGHFLYALVRAHRNRQAVRALVHLDRRMLADIGVTQSDLRDAFSEPFWEDPTVLLRARALERRVSRAIRPSGTALKDVRPQPMRHAGFLPRKTQTADSLIGR